MGLPDLFENLEESSSEMGKFALDFDNLESHDFWVVEAFCT